MKRCLCMLAALLAVSQAVSCGADTGPETDSSAAVTDTETEAVTKAPDLLDSLGPRDLEGYTYTIFDCNQYPEMHINMPGDAMTGEVVNDALFTRDAALEDRYNCKIEYYQENKIAILRNIVTSGDDQYQMIIHSMNGLSSQATAGYLANLCDIPHVEPDQPWWNPLLYDSLRLHDAMYITSSDIAPAIYQMPCCLFLNLKLYQDYDFKDDIFQMVIDGKWTIDVLRNMVKGLNEDLNGDQKWTVEDDFFGLATHNSSEAVLTFLNGMGVELSHISDDGNTITCDLAHDPRTVELSENISDLLVKITYSGTDINVFSNLLFKENRALFFMHKLESAAVHLRDMEADYLILPSPKYTEEQESYYSFLSPHGSCFIGIPQPAQANEKAGFLTEALARYSYQYVRPIAYDLVYKEKDSRDPRSADVLDILLSSLYIDFASLYDFGQVTGVLTSVVFDDKPLVSTLEKREKSIDKAIAKLTENWNPPG